MLEHRNRSAEGLSECFEPTYGPNVKTSKPLGPRACSKCLSNVLTFECIDVRISKHHTRLNVSTFIDVTTDKNVINDLNLFDVTTIELRCLPASSLLNKTFKFFSRQNKSVILDL
jgi:hypothetical protein